jgi:hypothetical protein
MDIELKKWHTLRLSDVKLMFWLSKQLDNCNIKYTNRILRYRIYTTCEMYNMIVDYVKCIASITAYN